jgi:hypothetical protein
VLFGGTSRFRAVLFMPLTIASRGTALHAQEIGIKLVNGQNGRPIAGTCVNVWVNVGSPEPEPIAALRGPLV